ncbi:hypothetical protein [Thermosediminibacter litoriperuensis]|uniref:Uncharacterized protein n=1 Tax=Thermosediminibacter litoriperuensis TaxID=291989 RepID=A0A5S5ARD8_9FIRM|nr:hypothetical protein [Thermosediminibacter litoriperuensis]TYP54264.1 hypothetical protein LZ11_01330 [Thermosediminibacter litoriperuensis]
MKKNLIFIALVLLLILAVSMIYTRSIKDRIPKSAKLVIGHLENKDLATGENKIEIKIRRCEL